MLLLTKIIGGRSEEVFIDPFAILEVEEVSGSVDGFSSRVFTKSGHNYLIKESQRTVAKMKATWLWAQPNFQGHIPHSVEARDGNACIIYMARPA
jgi:hypothetical protein